MDQDVECIKSICEMEERHITPVTEDEVHKALNRLKNNKAVDSVGLCSEVGGWGNQFLRRLLNCMIKLNAVSVDLKGGILKPIYKKGDPFDPGNYRDILEHVLNTRHNKILEETKSRLLKELTSVCSSLNSALILSECRRRMFRSADMGSPR